MLPIQRNESFNLIWKYITFYTLDEDTLYLTADTLLQEKRPKAIYLKPILEQTSKALTWLDSAIL